MRVLATIGFSFSAGLFLAALLPWDGWYLYAAAVIAVATAAWALLLRGKRGCRRGVMILLSLAAALVYFTGYDRLIRQPVEAQCGEEADFSAVVCDWPVETEWGAKVTVRLRGFFGARAVYYGDSDMMALQPGNEVTGCAQWQSAAQINGSELTHLNARGVYALLYRRGEAEVTEGTALSLRWLPQRAVRALQETMADIWDDPSTLGFLVAELTGDKSLVPEEDYVAVQEAGLAHIFAVSGLHCAFLVTLLSLLIPAGHRRLLCGVTVPVLLFYMVMVGLSPSVVRSCIMQLFLLTAPLFRRGSDPLTSLAAALTVILLVNPFAAGSISLQLSFAATLGMVLLTGRLYRFLAAVYGGKNRHIRGAVHFVAANVATTLSATVFTVPLTAYYFNILVLAAPLTGLLAVPAAGWAFISGLVSALLGLVWLPLGRIVGVAALLCAKYILWVSRLFLSLPYHAVYFSNVYLRCWLVYVYAAFSLCVLTRDGRRKYAVAAALSCALLLVCLWRNEREYHYGTMGALALDVGQGESVAIWSGGEAVLVDCGSSNSYVSAGSLAADRLQSIGIRRLSAVVITHYHADHTNGLYEVFARLPVDTLYLPDIEDEYGVRQRLEALAQTHGTALVYVTDVVRCPMGEAELTLYPPVTTGGDLNEQGLTVLASAGDFDLLITGDMPGGAEKKLMETYDLPDVEVLLVSHHGSRYSSKTEFLQAVSPEEAIISVGSNSYGHPAEETLGRLHRAGATVWRTDIHGTIRIMVTGG